MIVTSSQSFLLRPYSVTIGVPDDSLAKPQAIARLPAGLLGRALKSSAAAGQGVVVAAAAPGAAPRAADIDYKQLAKGILSVAGETVTGHAVAKSAWQLSSLSTTTTPQELTKILLSNHVSPEKAPAAATEILKVLHDPVTRGILIAVSAGAATYVVVQRTKLSTAKKWALIGAVMVLAGCAFAVGYRMSLVA